jgi:hypothetical protein
MATARIVLKARQAPDSAPLFIRASLSRTFRGLALFTLFGLICCGCYLLMDAISSPLEANQTAVLVSAAMLALATVLLFHMLSPLRRPALAERNETSEQLRTIEEAPLTPFGSALQSRIEAARVMETRDDLPGPM